MKSQNRKKHFKNACIVRCENRTQTLRLQNLLSTETHKLFRHFKSFSSRITLIKKHWMTLRHGSDSCYLWIAVLVFFQIVSKSYRYSFYSDLFTYFTLSSAKRLSILQKTSPYSYPFLYSELPSEVSHRLPPFDTVTQYGELEEECGRWGSRWIRFWGRF